MSRLLKIPICPSCSNEGRLVSGDQIYPHRPDLAHKKFYLCSDCDTFVGCHPGSIRPLGSMADKELRRIRSQTHDMFDRIWKDHNHPNHMSRYKAYQWLGTKLGLSSVHIGESDRDRCMLIQKIVRKVSYDDFGQ